MKILRAADRLATAWKNGLGVTREIAAHPPGAGLDDFDWRISMATVDAGGPFSDFPGVDRRLAVLDGVMVLRVDGGSPVELNPACDPLDFPGDVPVDSDVLAGPVTDLNVMVRRGRFRATVTRLEIDRPLEIAVPTTTFLFVHSGFIGMEFDKERQRLSAHDAVLLDTGFEGSALVESQETATVLLVSLESLVGG